MSTFINLLVIEDNPADFRRKATFEEATGFLAPAWHR